MSTVRTLDRRLTPRSTAATTRSATVTAAPTRHRARDFGIGYGSSSGYGPSHHYADTRGQAYFRCR